MAKVPANPSLVYAFSMPIRTHVEGLQDIGFEQVYLTA